MKLRYLILIIIAIMLVGLLITEEKHTLLPTHDKEKYINKNTEEELTNKEEIQKNSNVNSTIKSIEELDKKMKTKTTLFSLLKMGGWAMYLLIPTSILGLAFILERSIILYRSKLSLVREKGDDFIEFYKGHSPEATLDKYKDETYTLITILCKGIELYTEGVDRMEKVMESIAAYNIAVLEKGLNILSAVGNIAPLIGFLGTVSGMIGAFQTIANADQVNARLVASGIYEALITTAVGLIIAIPSLAFHNYFIDRIDKYTTQIEKYASMMITETLKKNKHKVKN